MPVAVRVSDTSQAVFQTVGHDQGHDQWKNGGIHLPITNTMTLTWIIPLRGHSEQLDLLHNWLIWELQGLWLKVPTVNSGHSWRAHRSCISPFHTLAASMLPPLDCATFSSLKLWGFTIVLPVTHTPPLKIHPLYVWLWKEFHPWYQSLLCVVFCIKYKMCVVCSVLPKDKMNYVHWRDLFHGIALASSLWAMVTLNHRINLFCRL